MRSVRGARRPLVALIVLVVALAVGYSVRAARSDGPGAPQRPTTSVALSSLPPQAVATVRLIDSHGPYPFPADDGVVFHNYEHVLPREPDGYYHEYTVPTPGSDDRGARRLVTGRNGAYFYTDDHYETFERVDVNR